MKQIILSAIASSFVIASPSLASDEPVAVKVDAPATDCAKETWPHFSPSCLRDANSVNVRVVSSGRQFRTEAK